MPELLGSLVEFIDTLDFLGTLLWTIPVLVVCGTLRNALWSIGGHHPAGNIVRQTETGLCHRDCKRCARDRADPNDQYRPKAPVKDGW